MVVTNADEIEAARPEPIDDSVLPLQAQHRSDAIWNGQDAGALTCHSRNEEFNKLEPMVDERVVDIIKGDGFEGLLRTLGREIDHGLITALVEQWQPETHTFHMPHGERILIKRLLEQVALTLLPNVEEDQVVVGPKQENRPFNVFLLWYPKQIASMLLDQICGGRSILIGHRNMMGISKIGVIDSNSGVMQYLVTCLLTMRYLRLLRRHGMGTPDYKDITDVLKAVNEIDCVRGHIAEAPNDKATTLEAAAIERPSTSTTAAECGRG
ncbi:hypothetical protein SO802_009494 [Lithocarpus litseifolius]|uniref:Aminotransferase-like plant mobile domain-containing protein n=1 Tax=Lithocarpus litseifolius TaxID=425828 RepID=A0AAW2DC37_9ROSI